MKKLSLVVLAFAMMFSLTACASEPEVVKPEPTQEQVQEEAEEVIVEIQGDGWMYNLESKTLQVDGLMENFEIDGNGVSTAPWGEYLVETEHIIVGENMNWIAPNAFANCSNLKTVDVKSQNFEYIETNAFSMCGDIENQSELVFTFNSAPGYGDDAFLGTIDNPNAVVIVPDMYKGSWGYYLFQKPMHVEGYEYAPKNMDEIAEMSFDRARPVDWADAEGFYKHNGCDWNKNNTKTDFGEDKMTFASSKNPAKIYLRTRLNKHYDNNGETQQAVILKFIPENATELSFNFKDKTEFSFDFKEDDVYFNYKANDGEIAFSEYMPNDFDLKSDSSYYLFFAFDADANIRALVYEEDNYLNRAEFETSLYRDDDKIFNNKLKMSIFFGANQQFSICEYSVWTFENLIKSTVYEGSELGEESNHQNNFEDINLDDPNSISSIFLNDMQFMTGGTPDSDMQEDFSFVAVKNKSADGSYVEFGSDDEGASFTRGESLYYDSRNNNQAVLFRFMPNDTEDLIFTISNENEISMKFIDGMPYHVNMKNGSETHYSEYGPANITLEQDKWYWALMAVDGNGTYRSAVWKEEDPMTGANCQDDTGVTDGAWDWNISFGANQTFMLGEYIVFDFDSINNGLNNEGNISGESNEDYGPYWEIDMGNDFFIMSDMVWHEYEPQDFKIGSGDTFKGYVLKDFLDMSGNSSDVATVVLEDGSEVEANPTFDAFVVYKQNDEFMGGPYLLTMNGLSQSPITGVQPK